MAPRILVTVLILVTSFKGLGQTYSSVVPDLEIHTFFYELNKSKAVHIYKLSPRVFPSKSIDTSNKELPFYFLNKANKEYTILKSSFTQADIEFIKTQYIALNDTSWNFRELKGFIPADSLVNREIVKQSLSGKRRIKGNYSYTFSIPLFSIDRKTVIIYQDYFCGSLCSHSCMYMYKKGDKGIWRQILSWDCWAS